MRVVKHFSFLFLLSLLISSCAPRVTPAPAAPTAMPTPAPTSTATLIPDTVMPEFPTPTASATEVPDDDILTRAQKERLHRTALTFLASTQEQAFEVVESLHYVQYAHPSNMCGPLAMAELREAGLVSRYTDLHDFWLMRPDVNAATLERTFPPERFEHFRFFQSTGEFDFKQFPLKAGDFIYLYAGDRGTFEHIITVTRVDEQGRAYTVTNLNTRPYPNYYYVIREVMLYDPSQPGVGQFYEWTDETKNAWVGLTGYGGFEVWRFSAPVQDDTPQEIGLADEMDAIFEEAGGDWHALILDLETGRRVYERRSHEQVHVASVIKVPLAMLVFASLETRGIPGAELKSYIETHGDGFLLGQLLRDMLVISDEKAADELLAYVRRSGLEVNATLWAWGAPNMNMDKRTAPLDEVARLLAGLYQGQYIAPQARQIILDLMAEYSPGDDTRLGVLSALLPEGGKVYNKRGTITAERLVVGDAAILTWPAARGRRVYVIVIFGYPGEEATNDLKLEAGIEQAARAFWEFAK